MRDLIRMQYEDLLYEERLRHERAMTEADRIRNRNRAIANAKAEGLRRLRRLWGAGPSDSELWAWYKAELPKNLEGII